MSPQPNRLSMTLTALLGFAAMGAAPAEEVAGVDTSGWDCTLCTWPYGWWGEPVFGPGWVSDASPKFGDYRALEDDGVFASLSGEARYLDESGRFFEAHAHELGLDSRRLIARGGRRGEYRFRIAYTEIPKYRGFGTSTPYLGIGGDRLDLPQGWIAAPGTSGMSALDASVRPATLELDRRTLDVDATVRINPSWTWSVDVSHARKDGTRPFGAGVFTIQSGHFPAPVDFTTDRAGISLSYDGRQAQFTAGISGSWFDNGSAAVTWSNPFQALPGTEILRASLEPDNSAWQAHLAGAWNPTRGLRISGRAAFGRLSQDDPFLPYTTNETIPDVPLPRTSLDGRIDATTLDLSGRMSWRVSSRLDLTAKVDFDERDNHTPISAWRPVVTDLVQRPETFNRPYSFERRDYSLEGRYRAGTGTRLRVGVKHRHTDRSLQSVARTGETTAWGEAGFSPWAIAQFRVRYESADRDASDYEPFIDPGLPESPLMRKFNLADRERRRAVIEFDLSPLDAFTISLAYYATRDDYERSPIGLQSSDERSINLDASYAPGRDTALHAFITHDEIDAEILGDMGLDAGAWRARTGDRFLTWGLGATHRVDDRISLRLDYTSSESEGDIHTVSVGTATEPPFPTLTTDLRNLRLTLDYELDQRWQLRAALEHERYQTHDWQVDGIGPDGIEAILTMGLVSPDYSVTVIRLLASHRF